MQHTTWYAGSQAIAIAVCANSVLIAAALPQEAAIGTIDRHQTWLAIVAPHITVASQTKWENNPCVDPTQHVHSNFASACEIKGRMQGTVADVHQTVLEIALIVITKSNRRCQTESNASHASLSVAANHHRVCGTSDTSSLRWRAERLLQMPHDNDLGEQCVRSTNVCSHGAHSWLLVIGSN